VNNNSNWAKVINLVVLLTIFDLIFHLAASFATFEKNIL